MQKIARLTLTILIFGLLLSACAAPAAPTQDPAVAAATIAAQVEAQVSTRVAQAMANLEATQRAQPTAMSVIPTSSNIPTVAPLNLPTAALPGVATTIPCNATPTLLSENIDDGTDVYLNTSFTKSWTLRNEGSCTWNSNYKVKFMSGDPMSGPTSKSFGATVTPGNSLTITLPLKAPGGTGTYKGIWGLYDDKNVFFGQMWVEIDAVTIAPTSSAFAVTKIHFYIPTPGSCVIFGDITTNAGGNVKFQWMVDGVLVGNVRSQAFTAAGTATSTWTIVSAGSPHTVAIYVDVPNHSTFGALPFSC
jgi:hypothetical protein